MNFCLTDVKAAFDGISVFTGIVVFLTFSLLTSLLPGEREGEWKNCMLQMLVCDMSIVCCTLINRECTEDFTDLT